MTIAQKIKSTGEAVLNSFGMRMVGDTTTESGCCCKNCCKIIPSSPSGFGCCFSKTSTIALTLTLTRGGSGCVCATQDFDVASLSLKFYGCSTAQNSAIWISDFFDMSCVPSFSDTYYFYVVTYDGNWRVRIYTQKQGTPGKFPASFGTLRFDFSEASTNCCGISETGVSDSLGTCPGTTADMDISVVGNTCCRSDATGNCCECESSDCETGICDPDGPCACECVKCDTVFGCDSLPGTLSIDVAGFTGSASGLNGTYTLTRPFGSSCVWTFQPGGSGACTLDRITLTRICGAATQCTEFGNYWQLAIRAVDSTGAFLRTLYYIWATTGPSGGDSCLDSIYGTFPLTCDPGGFDCGTSNASTVEIS